MIRLENSFDVGLPVQQTWDLLTDLPLVAGCLPGARLDEVADGRYRGGISTKIGPVNARYQGTASFLEHDEVDHRAVIVARGREEKGSGSASATITTELTPAGASSTRVRVLTDLDISGRAAQFGRSLLVEVSSTLVDEFVRRLQNLSRGDTGPDDPPPARPAGAADTAGGSGTSTPAAHEPTRTGANELDLARTVLVPLLRRAAAPLAATCAGLAVGVLLGRRRGRPGGTWTVYVVAPSSDHRAFSAGDGHA